MLSGQSIKGILSFTFIAQHHGLSEIDGYFNKFDSKIAAVKDDFQMLFLKVRLNWASINTEEITTKYFNL